MEYETLLRQYRRKRVIDESSLPVTLSYGQDGIKKIIPQRDPLLFVDRLTGIDIKAGLISGVRTIDPADPVFAGHFPGYPVYPGSFTLEMIGQLCLCLYYFLEGDTTCILDNAKPVSARATRVLGAYFLHPILPGSEVTLLARKIEYSGFLATAIGQAIVDGTVCCITAGEVAILD